MNNNIVFAFIGGTAVGALSMYATMTKLGYIRLTPRQRDTIYAAELGDKKESFGKDESPTTPQRDKPSFEQSKTIDTHKTSYDGIVTKPSLEEVSKKYKDAGFDQHMAERESPEEDEADDEEGSYLGSETEEERELADAMIEPEETDGFGHVIMQLSARSKDQLIYLVPQDYAGEIYLLDDLIYYEGDDVLSDLTDAPVDDPLAVIGDSLGYFGQYGADEGKLFVRNCNIGVEYEITLEKGRYADHLYGVNTEEIDETPKVQKVPRRRKKEEK